MVSRTYVHPPKRTEGFWDISDSVIDASWWGLTAFSVVGMSSVRDHGTFLDVVFGTTLTGLGEEEEEPERASDATLRAL